MADKQTTVMDLRQLVEDFVNARDWHQFHTPKNLSMSLAIETSELMEHFQWIDGEESRNPAPEQLSDIKEELADCLCYAIAIANELQIDISQAMADKMVKNEKKYPADRYRGRFE